MNNKDKKFIQIWSRKIEQGVLRYYLTTVLITCASSVAVVLLYTWGNIPKGNYHEAILPLSVLIFGLGFPLGLLFSWVSWTKNNNRYKFLTTGNNLALGKEKKKWCGYDRVWDIAIPNVGAIYFVLLYTSIFLFDSGRPTLLKYSIVGVILSYFVVQIAYVIYRYWVDKLGETKRFPLAFKYLFIIIIFLTLILWSVFFI